MLDVCLLGTGGMMPLPNRYLTSLMTRYKGSNLLIDCGEGVQNTIRLKGWSFKRIDTILITHFHGDHIAGLPGLLLTMGNSNRTETLTMVGPKGLEHIVNSLRVIARDLPFNIEFIELSGNDVSIKLNGYKITAFKLNHRIACYGYTLDIERPPMFDKDRALAQDIPVRAWSHLQKGETVVIDGKTYEPSQVLGEPRKGIRVLYATDTRPVQNIVTFGKDADLMICEGMYGDEEGEKNCKAYKHMTFQEASKLAKDAGARELWLTHFSPALVKPQQYEEVARKIFPNAHVGKDRKSTTIKYEN